MDPITRRCRDVILVAAPRVNQAAFANLDAPRLDSKPTKADHTVVARRAD